MGTVKGICISEKRGTAKSEISCATLKENWGIVNDAHAGNWHRQISLLSFEKIEQFRKKGADVSFGAFGENFIIEGFDLRHVPVGSKITIGKTILQVTQIGKDCHSHCAIYKEMGDCIMPREGIFAKVIKGGEVKVGDQVDIHIQKDENPITVAVVTLSDKGANGQREDKSGPTICDIVKEAGWDVVETLLLPDEKEQIKKELIRLCDQRQVNLILTTGGTGFAKRDVTPEATIEVCDRMANGIAEAIRAYSMNITKRAMLSRAVSGIRKETLIVNLPGSPKAVRESLECIMPQLPHGIGILRGTQGECART